jgi:hypothetical protein
MTNKGNCDKKYKFQCGIRQMLKWRQEWGKDQFREYLIKSKFDQKIIESFVEQWNLGNRGELNTWKDTLSQQQGLDI